jgi:hypothetical protein
VSEFEICRGCCRKEVSLIRWEQLDMTGGDCAAEEGLFQKPGFSGKRESRNI